MSATRPWLEGAGPAHHPVDPQAVIPKLLLPLGGRGSLVELSGELAFFTPALLYLHEVLQTDGPLRDFMAEYRQEVPLYHYRFRQRLFAGLDIAGDEDWNHVLWAVDRSHWPPLLDFLCSLCFVDVTQRRVSRIGAQTLRLADPLILEHGVLLTTTVPTLAVTALGVNASDRRVAFVPAQGPFGVPRAHYFPADPAMRRQGKALLRGDLPDG